MSAMYCFTLGTKSGRYWHLLGQFFLILLIEFLGFYLQLEGITISHSACQLLPACLACDGMICKTGANLQQENQPQLAQESL